MNNSIKSVLIVVNHHKPESRQLVEDIVSYLNARNISTHISGYREVPGNSVLNETDLAFSLGGDGTVLFSARMLASRKVPILAVNLGDFGFITEVSQNEWKSAFEKYQQGFLGISKRIMMSGEVKRGDTLVAQLSALNDCVISSGGKSKIVRLEVDFSTSRLGAYRADGIIISTPTGSTAYSMAAGGPILDPEMEAMIINPICPFTLSNRPIVVPSHETISVHVKQEQRTEILLSADGQDTLELLPGDRVNFTMSSEKALIVHSDKRSFYEVLRSKLKWSGGPDA